MKKLSLSLLFILLFTGSVFAADKDIYGDLYLKNGTIKTPTDTDVIATINAKANSADVLEKNNTTTFNPTTDYQPATVKYVNDHTGTGDMTVDTAQDVTGVKELQDNVSLNFGNDADFKLRYDGIYDHRFEVVSDSTSDTTIDIANLGTGKTNLQLDGKLIIGENGTHKFNVYNSGNLVLTSEGDVAYDGTTHLFDFFDGSDQNQHLVVSNQEIVASDAIEFVLNGGGSAITTGLKGYLRVPWSGTITSQELVCNQSGSIVLDIWVDSFDHFPPNVADTITASAKPTLSSAQTDKDTTLTGWSTTVTAGDWFVFYVDSATTVTTCTLSLQVTK